MAVQKITYTDEVLPSMTKTCSPSALAVLGWCLLVAVVVAQSPLFVCMPLWVDSVHYDLCARNVLSGGVLYRDASDVNLPGMMWIHTAIRGLFGWRSEVLRIADLVVLAATVVLMLRLANRSGAPPAAAPWIALAAVAFYLPLPEICHCQRDTWMMTLGLSALLLRQGTIARLAATESPLPIIARSLLEGFCWGAAVWIKPVIAVPATAVWVIGALYAFSRARATWRTLLVDLAGLLTGGLLAGSVGLLMLWCSGSLPYFWETLFGASRQYAQALPRWQARLSLAWLVAVRRFPWSVVLTAALILSATRLWRAMLSRRSAKTEKRSWTAWAERLVGCRSGEQDLPPGGAARVTLAAFLLAWAAQGVFGQFPHEYVLVATMFPAITILASWRWLYWPSKTARIVLFLFLVVVVSVKPPLDSKRLDIWPRCWLEGSTPEVRDVLGEIIPVHPAFPRPCFRELVEVETFLRHQDICDGQLFTWDDSPMPLYLSLNVQPPGHIENMGPTFRHFPQKADEFVAKIQRLAPRYVVIDLAALKIGLENSPQPAPGEKPALPPEFPPRLLQRYPWRERPVLRTGRYVVLDTSPVK